MFSPFRKKKEESNNSETLESDVQPVRREKKGGLSFNMDDLRYRVTGMSPIRLTILVGLFPLLVFGLHEAYGVWQSHKRVQAEEALFSHPIAPPSPIKNLNLPDLSVSEKKLYMDLARMSEISPILLEVKSDRKTFAGWAKPLGALDGVSMARIRLVVEAPLTTALAMFPELQASMIRRHAVITSVMYNRGGGTTGKSQGAIQPKIFITADIYGSSPKTSSEVEKGVESAKGLKGYLHNLTSR